MTPKGKKLLAVTIVFTVLMFLWILVAVLLTGGRDIGEFTPTDKTIMWIFAGVEIATVTLAFVFACKTGKENRKKKPVVKPHTPTQTDKAIHRRGVILVVIAGVLTYGVALLGIAVKDVLPGKFTQLAPVLIWSIVGVVLVLAAVNILLRRSYIRRLDKQPVEQIYRFWLSHRDEAEKTAAKKYAFLRRWRGLTQLYGCVFALLGLVMAFCVGIHYSNFFVPLWWLSGTIFMCALSRIRFSMPESFFADEKTYIDEEQFPQLYALTRKAAEAVGCRENIRIGLLANNNAGIAKIGDTHSVLLGVVLLKSLSEEEIYNILLHEFCHMAQQKKDKEDEYHNWLRSGKTEHFLQTFTTWLFVYFDEVYLMEYGLYLYAVTLQRETEADSAMAQRGDPETAASALLKIKYYDLFDWEKNGHAEQNLYTEETPGNHVLADEIAAFQEAMENRTEEWNALTEKEILSRSASHPTIAMRIRFLGVSGFRALPYGGTPEYMAECDRALDYLDKYVWEMRQEEYAEKRRLYYLEPKQQVEEWEKTGKPVEAETFGDIVWNLRQLGRLQEAMELCQKAIETLPAEANHQAYFNRGCYRLCCYDAAGLEDIYHAIEHNSNYIQDGLNMIGRFCCITGNQGELDVYREKAVRLAQAHADAYRHMSELSKKDQLVPEQLPPELHQGLMEQLHSLDSDCIQQVYLVRKVITQDFFASAVVVRFAEDTDDEVCNDILHKLFCYLDTCSDWQFTLFDYRDVAGARVERIENSCIYEK